MHICSSTVLWLGDFAVPLNYDPERTCNYHGNRQKIPLEISIYIYMYMWQKKSWLKAIQVHVPDVMSYTKPSLHCSILDDDKITHNLHTIYFLAYI